MLPIKERLLRHRLITSTGCWQWVGGLAKNGYATIHAGRDTSTNKKIREYAHRVSYRLFKDEIPVGTELDHLCRNRACFNPEHLEAVTRSENSRRGIHKEVIRANFLAHVTACPKGHPYDDANTYHRPHGGRGCKACRQAQAAAYEAARRKVRAPAELVRVAD